MKLLYDGLYCTSDQHIFPCLSRPTDRNGRRDLARTKEAIIDPLSLVQLREQPSKDAYAAREIFGPEALESLLGHANGSAQIRGPTAVKYVQ